jgi:hypothetical protein
MTAIHRVRRGEKLGIINDILEQEGCVVIENVLDDMLSSDQRSDDAEASYMGRKRPGRQCRGEPRCYRP